MTGAGPVRIVETHTSYVVLVGERAYKSKKPVRFGFVDLSTPERRERAVRREVELNRRLAPDVYLTVGVFDAAEAGVVEHVVVMRRMPDDRCLATLVERGVDVRDGLDAVARTLARFHATAARSAAVDAAGTPDALRTAWRRNVDELDATGMADVADVDELGTRYLAGRGPLLEARVRAGAIRDGHGDLLAGDIYLLPDGPRILDCLEFDDALRYGDVLADVAFLAMDLERLGGTRFARHFLDRYAELSGASWPVSLEHFYVAARALVRAKVACLRYRQGGREGVASAPQHLALARRHLRAGRVRLVLVGGLPGTGKSTLAASLADLFGWTLLRSDVVRKQMFGVPLDAWHPESFRTGLYSPEATGSTYAEMLRRTELLLGAGESVVLDATWLEPAHRAAAAAVAGRTSSDLVEILCATPVPVAAERVLARAYAHTDPSDATPEVVHAMAGLLQPWPSAVTVDTTAGREAALAQAVEAVS